MWHNLFLYEHVTILNRLPTLFHMEYELDKTKSWKPATNPLYNMYFNKVIPVWHHNSVCASQHEMHLEILYHARASLTFHPIQLKQMCQKPATLSWWFTTTQNLSFFFTFDRLVSKFGTSGPKRNMSFHRVNNLQFHHGTCTIVLLNKDQTTRCFTTYSLGLHPRFQHALNLLHLGIRTSSRCFSTCMPARKPISKKCK